MSRATIAIAMLGGMFGFTVANFAYQALGDGYWIVATERTLFQIVAITGVWLSLLVGSHKTADRGTQTSGK